MDSTEQLSQQPTPARDAVMATGADYPITIECTSDIGQVEIMAGDVGIWTKPDGFTLNFTFNLPNVGLQIKSVSLSDKIFLVNQGPSTPVPTPPPPVVPSNFMVAVRTTSDRLRIRMSRGNTGYIKITSPVDNAINIDVTGGNPGGGPNTESYVLILNNP